MKKCLAIVVFFMCVVLGATVGFLSLFVMQWLVLMGVAFATNDDGIMAYMYLGSLIALYGLYKGFTIGAELGYFLGCKISGEQYKLSKS